jgi:hemin uptake protein HemP
MNIQFQKFGADAIRTIQSVDLFRGTRVVCIEHDGQRYLLRVTRENKLILTK